MKAGPRNEAWDVDAADAPEGYVEYLVDNSESELMQRTVRQRLHDHGVSRHRAVLDLGCGIGTHARLLAQAIGDAARVVGIDRSRAMLKAARAQPDHGARYLRADAHRLPFAAASFDLVWVERTLVHLADPLTALREARRVLQRGGRALVAEADYGGVVFDAPDEALWRALEARWLRRKRHPDIGRRLLRLLRDAGFDHVELHPELRSFDGVAWADRSFGLRRRGQELVDDGSLPKERMDRFWAELEQRDRSGRFFMAIPFLVASAS